MGALRHLAYARNVSLPGASVEALVGVRVGVALQQLALAVDEPLVDGHPVVADRGEDHGLAGAEVMVHTHAEQGLERRDKLILQSAINYSMSGKT